MFHIQKRTADLGSHFCDISLCKYSLENDKVSVTKKCIPSQGNKRIRLLREKDDGIDLNKLAIFRFRKQLSC